MSESSINEASGSGAEFYIGQDVRLTPEQSLLSGEGMAVAGTVTDIERQTDGTPAYTVHFPGAAGVQHGLTDAVIEAETSPAVRPRDGTGPFSIKDAEELIINDELRIPAKPGRANPDGAAILTELAKVCGIGTYDLAEQLIAKIGQRKQQEHRPKRRTHPAALAANDIPPRSASRGVSIDLTNPEQTPVQQPRRSRPSQRKGR